MPNQLRSLAGITEYGLPNGFRLLLIPDPSQPTVTVNLTIFAGSAYEGYGETGAAHLLEHLAFKGSPDFPDVPAVLNEHGASWNGTTWTDRTNYYETMPASDENLDFGVRFEAARLVRSHIRAEDLKSEMTVVRNEFEEGENHPSHILIERIMSTAYLFHGYGHASIGARSDIENIPIERLKAFYQRWYRPDNAMLVIAGRFDEQKALTSVDAHFGPLTNPDEPLPTPYTTEPPQDGERAVTLRRVGEIGAVAAAYHIPGAAHPDCAALEVLSEVLAATPSGRLYKQMVEAGEAVRASAMVQMFREPGIMTCTVEARKDADLDQVGEHLLALVEGFDATPPTAIEVERGRNSLLADRTLAFGNSERLAIEMSEWAAMGDWRLFFSHQRALESVQPDDVQRVALTYLRQGNRTFGRYIPSKTSERVEIPPVGDVHALLGDLSHEQTLGEPEALDIDAATLEARTERRTISDGRFGMAMLPRRTRGELVSGRVLIPVGNAPALVGHGELNDMVALLLERGTKQRDRAQLKDDFDRLRADVRLGGSVNETVVRFTTTRQHLGEVVELVLEMLREPALDEREFALLKRERLAELEEALHEPSDLAQSTLRNYLYPREHLRHSLLLKDALRYIEELQLEAVQEFHRQFYGAEQGWLALAGDFAPDAACSLTEKQLRGWRSAGRSERVELRVPPPVAPVVREIECHDKENALTIAARTYRMTRDDPRYAPLLLANYIFGGEALGSRLSLRLRQTEGLCYGAGSHVAVDLTGDLGTFTFWAISAPQNAERVEQGFRDELDKLRDSGFDQKELERAKGVYLEQIDVRLARDAVLAAEMVEQMIQRRDFGELQVLREAVRAVRKEEAEAVVREVLDPGAIALVRAGDFARVRAA